MNVSNFFADSMWDLLPALMIPMIIFMIPIIGILTKHQQKMAELIHGGKNSTMPGEVEMMRREMAELKAMVHQQTLMIDELMHQQKSLPVAGTNVSSRIESGL